jgi:hypothetical protein
MRCDTHRNPRKMECMLPTASYVVWGFRLETAESWMTKEHSPVRDCRTSTVTSSSPIPRLSASPSPPLYFLSTAHRTKTTSFPGCSYSLWSRQPRISRMIFLHFDSLRPSFRFYAAFILILTNGVLHACIPLFEPFLFINEYFRQISSLFTSFRDPLPLSAFLPSISTPAHR